MKRTHIVPSLTAVLIVVFAGAHAPGYSDVAASVDHVLKIERPPRADVVVYNQLTAAGHARFTPPTADNPQRYILANHGIQELGPRYRANRRAVTEGLIQDMIIEGLARSHFVPAKEGDTHLDLAIASFIGIITRDVVHMGGGAIAGEQGLASGELDFDQSQAILDSMAASAQLNELGYVRNFEDLQALVGGASLFRMSHLDPKRQRFMQEANSDRFFIILMAYDGAEVVAGEENPTLLWIARMSVATAGTTMREALPAMVVAGQDFFGRDTRTPAMIGFRQGEPRVIIGEPEMVDVVDD